MFFGKLKQHFKDFLKNNFECSVFVTFICLSILFLLFCILQLLGGCLMVVIQATVIQKYFFNLGEKVN